MPSDVTAPQILSVEIDRTSINLDNGETTVIVTARLSDDLSGIFDVTKVTTGGTPPQIQFNHSIYHTVTGVFDIAHPLSGDVHDGIFRATLTLPATAASGVWNIERMLANDGAGNSTWIYPATSSLLAGLAFTVTNSHEDITAPQLHSISLSDAEIDFAAGERSVVVTAHLSDVGSGLFDPQASTTGGGLVQIQFRTAGGQTVSGIFDIAHPISGDSKDGVFQAVVTLNDSAEAGEWAVERVILYDQAQNPQWLYPTNSSLLSDLSFTVSNAGSDITKPTFEWLELGEPVLNPDGTSTFKVRAHFTDDLSGVFDVTQVTTGGTPPQVDIVSSSGQQVTGVFDIAHPVSGDRHDGVFEATLTLGAFAEAGIWHLNRLIVVDQAQNFAWFTSGDSRLSGTIQLGSEQADSFEGTGDDESLFGFGGADKLAGKGGDDTLNGGDGDDAISGGSGKDKIVGGSGRGNDKYDGGSGVDEVLYKSATKAIVVDLAKHKASGTEIGKDTLRGIEDVVGGAGGDTIRGDGHANMFDGLNGKDSLTGGGGRDTFLFSTKLGAKNVDTITDFKHDADLIALDDAIFASIGPSLSRGEFFAKAGATKAHDGNDRIIYDKSTGRLSYDDDGKGGHAAIHFATLAGKPTLDHGDFVIV